MGVHLKHVNLAKLLNCCFKTYHQLIYLIQDGIVVLANPIRLKVEYLDTITSFLARIMACDPCSQNLLKIRGYL